MTGFAAALDEGPLVLDGGLSNELEALGADLGDALWSARLLADDPALVRAAHAAYVRAGAQVLITASYQASFEGFARRGATRSEAGRLLRRSVGLAREAAEEAGGEHVFVAGSVGPYGAVLADGSEYTGRYGLSTRELADFHRPRVEALAEAGPDVLALETVPSAAEAEALLLAVEGCGLPVWLSFTASGGRTRTGEPLGEALALAAGVEQVAAVGVNCCTVQEATRALPLAAERAGKPGVVYPNSGEGWDADRRAWRGEPSYDPAAPGLVDGWIGAGARLVGGCCRVGPERIAAVRRALS
ncbi:homocysteine S-methyltransferase [Streptomyces xiaopingdaonensis]|uniref:homocysteine S-methyltransferase n=1 Tax=Streptomyces xiaopingdaonensis TaxID=1565415 RepID=UPI00031DD0F1|nr:homocysteine S-methyltransferase [Streptomyces xiaopingdaonensis]